MVVSTPPAVAVRRHHAWGVGRCSRANYLRLRKGEHGGEDNLLVFQPSERILQPVDLNRPVESTAKQHRLRFCDGCATMRAHQCTSAMCAHRCHLAKSIQAADRRAPPEVVHMQRHRHPPARRRRRVASPELYRPPPAARRDCRPACPPPSAPRLTDAAAARQKGTAGGLPSAARPRPRRAGWAGLASSSRRRGTEEPGAVARPERAPATAARPAGRDSVPDWHHHQSGHRQICRWWRTRLPHDSGSKAQGSRSQPASQPASPAQPARESGRSHGGWRFCHTGRAISGRGQGDRHCVHQRALRCASAKQR